MSLLTKCFQPTARFSRFFSTSAVRGYDDVNKVILVGRIGNDPEARLLPTEGKSVVNFSLATSETKLDKEGKRVQRTDWHRVTSWNDKTNQFIMERIKKGALVCVEGKLRYGQYQNAKGEMKYTTEIQQSQFSLLAYPPAKSFENQSEEIQPEMQHETQHETQHEAQLEADDRFA